MKLKLSFIAASVVLSTSAFANSAFFDVNQDGVVEAGGTVAVGENTFVSGAADTDRWVALGLGHNIQVNERLTLTPFVEAGRTNTANEYLMELGASYMVNDRVNMGATINYFVEDARGDNTGGSEVFMDLSTSYAATSRLTVSAAVEHIRWSGDRAETGRSGGSISQPIAHAPNNDLPSRPDHIDNTLPGTPVSPIIDAPVTPEQGLPVLPDTGIEAPVGPSNGFPSDSIEAPTEPTNGLPEAGNDLPTEPVDPGFGIEEPIGGGPGEIEKEPRRSTGNRSVAGSDSVSSNGFQDTSKTDVNTTAFIVGAAYSLTETVTIGYGYKHEIKDVTTTNTSFYGTDKVSGDYNVNEHEISISARGALFGATPYASINHIDEGQGGFYEGNVGIKLAF
jgi:hypothetical protein